MEVHSVGDKEKGMGTREHNGYQGGEFWANVKTGQVRLYQQWHDEMLTNWVIFKVFQPKRKDPYS